MTSQDMATNLLEDKDCNTQPNDFNLILSLDDLQVYPSTAFTFKGILKSSTKLESSLTNDTSRQKHVQFDTVLVYHFKRSQGFLCIPGQGGCSLGMEYNHHYLHQLPVVVHDSCNRLVRRVTLYEHALLGVTSLNNSQIDHLKDYLLKIRIIYENEMHLVDPLLSNPLLLNKAFLIRQHIHEVKERLFSLLIAVVSHYNCDELPDAAPLTTTNTSLIDLIVRSENELESTHDDVLHSIEDFYFTQALNVRQRRSVLKDAGVDFFNQSERVECQLIRQSRQICGCSCKDGICLPERCECALEGVACQVDRHNFPCQCQSSNTCHNKVGRVEFNPMRVHAHLIHTKMRLAIESNNSEGTDFPQNNVSKPKNSPALLHEDVTDNSVMTSTSSLSDTGAHAKLSYPESQSSDDVLASFNSTVNGSCRDCQHGLYFQALLQDVSSRTSSVSNSNVDHQQVDVSSYSFHVSSLSPGLSNEVTATSELPIANQYTCSSVQYSSDSLNVANYPHTYSSSSAMEGSYLPNYPDVNAVCQLNCSHLPVKHLECTDFTSESHTNYFVSRENLNSNMTFTSLLTSDSIDFPAASLLGDNSDALSSRLNIVTNDFQSISKVNEESFVYLHTPHYHASVSDSVYDMKHESYHEEVTPSTSDLSSPVTTINDAYSCDISVSRKLKRSHLFFENEAKPAHALMDDSYTCFNNFPAKRYSVSPHPVEATLTPLDYPNSPILNCSHSESFPLPTPTTVECGDKPSPCLDDTIHISPNLLLSPTTTCAFVEQNSFLESLTA